jgi:hypothetical protein
MSQFRRARGLFVICAALLSSSVALVAFAQSQKLSFKGAANSPIGVGNAPISVAAADLDGDGILDLAIANAMSNSITVLHGNGDGTFTEVANSPFATGANLTTAITIADVTGSGINDLVYTDIPGGLTGLINGITGSVGANVSVMLGSKGTFGGHLDNSTGGDFPTALAVGDFNADGKIDVAVTNFNSGNVSILLGKGDGTFTNAANSPIKVGTRPSAVAAGDFNRDGILDLAVANTDDGTMAILIGNNDGTFQAPTYLNVGIRPVAIAVADLNGDGKLDLAVVDFTSSAVFVLLGNGDGTFGAPASFGVGAEPSAVVAADFNGDGKLDLAVVNRLSNAVSILKGDGTGSFALSNVVPVRIGPQSVAFADFNRDGAMDLAVVNGGSNSVSVLLNITDTTPPVTTALATPGPNGNGWNNTSVSVTLSSTDSEPNGSGVKEIHYQIGAATPVVVAGASATVNFTTEGVFALSYFGVDNTGNVEATHSLTIQIDLTPPAISSSQAPPANSAGWNNTNVTVSFTCADNLSGVDTCTAPITVSTEGAGQVINGTATDKAGNSATTSRTINLDKTPPVLTMPTFASSYLLNSSLTLNFGATDALSGVASMQATLNGTPVTSGTTLTLTHLATNTFTLTATDVAGNTATQTATFAVVYNFIGFLPPIPNDGTGLFKLGSTVPVKFQLTDAKGTLISTAVAHLTIQMISGNTLQGTAIDATAPGNSDVGDLFRFDGTQYIFNWSTQPLSTGTWQLQARLDDGTVHTVVMGTK